MKKAKVIAIGTGAQKIVNHKRARRKLDVFSIDSEIECDDMANRGVMLAESSFDELDSFVKNTEGTVFLISTLGGITGSSATRVVATHLAEKGVKMVSIVTRPLLSEGCIKQANWQKEVRRLYNTCLRTIVVNLDDYVRRLGYKNAEGFYKAVDEEIYKDLLVKMTENNKDILL